MKNGIPFPARRQSDCVICGMPKGPQKRLRIEDLHKVPICDDCLLAFWEELMATDPSRQKT